MDRTLKKVKIVGGGPKTAHALSNIEDRLCSLDEIVSLFTQNGF